MSEPYPWQFIYNRVKSQIPAALDAVIRQEICAVAIDFTADTNIWVEDVPIVVPANSNQVTFAVTSGLPSRLMSVYDPAVDPVNKRWVSGGITMRIPGVLDIFQSAPEDRNWTVSVAKACNEIVVDPGPPPRPTGYPVIDDWIVDQNNDAFYYGAMFYLLRQPAKPYSNDKSASAFGAQYQSQKSTARVNNMRTNVYGGQAWLYPQGFATTSRKGWT